MGQYDIAGRRTQPTPPPVHPGHTDGMPHAPLLQPASPPPPNAAAPHGTDIFERRPTGFDNIAAIVEEDARRVREGQLRAPCAARFYPATAPARAVLVAFHGFTTGPFQFIELASHLNPQGLHVFAARTVGHGLLRDGAEDSSRIPGSTGAGAWQESADAYFHAARTFAQAHNLPLYVLGNSAGGTMALDLARRYGSDIDRCVLLAPFVRPATPLARTLFSGLDALDYGGVMSRLADTIPFGWGDPVRDDHPVHQHFALGNCFGLYRYSRMAVPPTLTMPTQFIVTDADETVCSTAVRNLFLASGGNDRGHRYHAFPRDQGVPHSMLSPYANPSGAGRDAFHRVVHAFLCDTPAGTGDHA